MTFLKILAGVWTVFGLITATGLAVTIPFFIGYAIEEVTGSHAAGVAAGIISFSFTMAGFIWLITTIPV